MILYALLSVVIFQTIGGDQIPEDSVRLLTKNNGKYHASFSYTVEDFLELPYVDNYPFIQSSPFSTKSEPFVKWLYEIEPGTESDEDVNLKLILSALPKNILRFRSSANCGIVDVSGKIQTVKNSGEQILQIRDSFSFVSFVTRGELERNRQQLLPGGHLTVTCDVEGSLMYHLNNTKGVIPTEEIKDDTPTSQCADSIADDTFSRLSLFDQNILGHVELVSSNYSFTCHKDILSVRSLYFKTMLLEFGDEEDVSLDLSNDLNGLELQDMVHFIYRGKATNFSKTCRVLYVVSNRYRLDCLREVCENVLVRQIKAKNALEYLKLGQDIGSRKLISAAAYCIYSSNGVTCR